MPTLKARICSSHPENAASLAEALKQQGYQVEVLHPEQPPGSPADLEIVLETCASVDVVRRAAELAKDFDADVAVAPSSLIATPRSPAEEILPLEAASEPDIESRLNSALRTQPEPSPVESAGQGPEASERDNPVPGLWTRAVPGAAVTLAGWVTAGQKAWVSARDQAREYREHALIRIAHLRAEHEARLLELTQRRIEAQEHASRLTTARKNAAMYLHQLRRESGGVIRPLGTELSQKEPAAGATHRPRHGLLQKLLARVRPLRWDAALAGVASAGALFAIGMAVASFNSKPALSAGDERPPAATSTPAAGTATQPPSPKTTSAARPSPARHAQAAKPSPAHAKPGRDRSLASRDQAAANDVVVRHFASPTPTPKVQAQGWKHFSDMDH
jgi:hypothetical protein